jgi:integral membrane protein
LTAQPTTTAGTSTPGVGTPLDPKIARTLLIYRIVAWIVGTGLVILVFVGIPLQVWGNSDGVVKVVGTMHGWLYMLYLVLVLVLARQCRWNPVRMILVMLAGTIPFLSFVAEHYTTKYVKATGRVQR